MKPLIDSSPFLLSILQSREPEVSFPEYPQTTGRFKGFQESLHPLGFDCA